MMSRRVLSGSPVAVAVTEHLHPVGSAPCSVGRDRTLKFP